MKYEITVEIHKEFEDLGDLFEFLGVLESYCSEKTEFSALIDRESDDEEVD